MRTAPAPGLSRDAAGALAREISGTAGYFGEVHRLIGEAPEPAGWAVRVSSVLSGETGLIRSRTAWAAYATRARAEEERTVERRPEQLEPHGPEAPEVVTAAPNGAAPAGALLPVAVGTAGAPTVAEWRALTERAIARAEAEAAQFLERADRTRAKARALREDARRLRRALAALSPGAPPRAPGRADAVAEGVVASPGGRGGRAPRVPGPGTIKGRVLAWARTHGGELVVGQAVAGLELPHRRVSAAAVQLRAAGVLEHTGQSRYRLLPGRDGSGAVVEGRTHA
jgi:hypothetical protein